MQVKTKNRYMSVNIKDLFYRNNGFLRTKDFTSRSHWYHLKGLINSGEAVKLKRGLYRLQQDCDIEQNQEIAQIVPSGVFCLFTAWQHYQLSTNNPFEYHVAKNRNDKIVLPAYPPVRLYRWCENFYMLGVVDIEQIKIYDLEKSVCDAVRFRNKVGLDIAIEVVKNYVRRKDRNFSKLAQYAQILRIEKIMQNMIMPML